MHFSFASYWVPLFAALACGGVAQQSSDPRATSAGDSQVGSGGGELGPAGVAGSSSGTNALPGGSGGSLQIEVSVAGAGGAGPGIRDGNACQFSPPTCNVVDQFIELEDGAHVARLAYPLDTSCGQCSAKCEVCDELTCSLWAAATTGCGKLNLRVAACSGLEGEPPCLDSTSDESYYVDPFGKHWELASLVGSGSQLPNPVLDGPVVLDLELTISDGTTTRTIAAHAHVCAAFYASLVICN